MGQLNQEAPPYKTELLTQAVVVAAAEVQEKQQQAAPVLLS